MILVAILASLLSSWQPGDSAQRLHNNGISVPSVTAVRTAHPAKLDGRLDEAVWRDAPAASNFWQTNPNEGEPATQRTEVRVLYDDDALYIGARMFEGDPGKIRAVLTRRDEASPSDNFTIALDTYHDHLTAVRFTVNPLGVRSDELAQDDLSLGDPTWDPVWEAATRIDSLGWTAELRIPMSQLRFSGRFEQIWGVNFSRYRSRQQEGSAFVLVKQSENGYASRFAHLVGIRGVPAPRHLELLPYARSQLEARPAEPGDPFFDGRELTHSAGLDVKYGITSNLTFDATFNPDFGQVEADPAVLNLTQFETFFEERRPFFAEGSQIFDFGAGGGGGSSASGAGQFFYSRRIGSAPSLYPDLAPVFATSASSVQGPFVDLPTETSILGAAKLTGKLPGGTSIGLLHAETGREFGSVYAEALHDDRVTRLRYRSEVEPRARYSVARFEQDFRGGATTIGAIVSHVQRDLHTSRLDSSFRSRAVSGGVDWQHRWDRNRLSLGGQVGWSYIRGSSAAIAEAQLSPSRYYQRPDQHHVRFDSTRTSLAGVAAAVGLSYDAPSGFSVLLSGSSTSPGFELNDVGFLTSADERSTSVSVGWQKPRPSERFRSFGVHAFEADTWTTGGTHLGRSFGISAFGSTQGGWSGSWSLSYSPRGLSKDATRGGPLMLSGRHLGLGYSASTDPRHVVSITTYGNRDRSEFGDRSADIGAFLNWRPIANVQLMIGPSFSTSHSVAFYATTVADTLASATYGTRYVFATLDQKNLSMTTRASVTFTPRLSWQLYMQLFTAAGRYSNFKELRRPRSFDFLHYGDDGSLISRDGTSGTYHVDPDGDGSAAPFTVDNPDIATRSLRGTAVLRWEYRPGATLYAVWTQSRSEFEQTGEFGGLKDVPALFGLPTENIFLLKISYWISR